MNKLSYLEKLLDGVEVEWLTAAEIFNIKNGYTPSKAKKEFWEDGTMWIGDQLENTPYPAGNIEIVCTSTSVED